MVFDAEGVSRHDRCPACASERTVTWVYDVGPEELECLDCGYRSDAASLRDLQRDAGDVLEGDDAENLPAPSKVRSLKA